MKAKFIGMAGLLAATALTAGAQVYQQLPSGRNIGGFRADLGTGNGDLYRWADNFRLNTSVAISAIEWWGGGTEVPDQFTVRIFADAGGVPGAPLLQFSAGSGSPRPTTEWIDQERGIQRMVYSASIPTVELPGQQQLWLSIQNTTDETWAWSFGPLSQPWGILRSLNGGSWGDPYGNDASFALFAVPEPSSFALLAFAGAALLLRRGRQ